MLSELKRYLSQRCVASLSDIALHLEVEPEVARAMLERWIAKGQVRRLTANDRCSGCDLCLPGAQELYCWRASQATCS
ncbi:MAG: sugar metabolism transcriptional regulator [Thiohalocapsa sp. PB-PSB1]|jgi:putative ferrous iron transport protein C|nr:MAG: hypothetical protein N838_15330 [Thiohalocapsa sp. PB-PSB1]QQO53036.1 MAG: sugar metabolism transcriptional regulator [Thiohalocapsa sp. PB-PSB1]HCS92110.1 sugar metabolism transcriptional regulator [Chromatiaceae bacterium]